MNKDLKKIIYNLETMLLKPEIRASINQISGLLSDDFIEFGSSGVIYDKKNILEALFKESKIAPAKFSISNFEVKELIDSLVLSTYNAERILPDGKSVISLRSSIWRRNDDGWQMIFHQGTPSN